MWGAAYNFMFGDFTPEEKTKIWRVLISSAFFVHIMYVCGWMPGISSGFASVDEVSRLQDTVESIQTKQLLEAIEKERRNACNHLAENNTAALDYAVRKRDELLREYKEVTGQEAQYVSCLELGIKVGEQ